MLVHDARGLALFMMAGQSSLRPLVDILLSRLVFDGGLSLRTSSRWFE